tara:strand:- start:45 stop:245 length:201 start_codon:yes stop_codon:yes gene_type:complete
MSKLDREKRRAKRKANRAAYKDYPMGSIERKDAKQEGKTEDIFQSTGPFANIRRRILNNKMSKKNL